ncbi:hypothetical protein H6F92_09320 [Microcystis wesenbergii FACHB-1317]|uniref:hypothetical protein n=1 Tax=Microcystis TaxID=1125 RepID=UPI000E38D910|nr:MULTISPECIES: hypothetical protein [Microcystis]MBD2288992.1 hypothetical protein [Microcystis wesenbergii FACHB-1317]REJ46022.1 MAG: hypothetical protein DWQ58_22005 [Microcystis aeruginosa TA09]UZO77027.1 hypothetical protein M8120_03005 [Microcystis aeruginosa str. Chao 1910]
MPPYRTIPSPEEPKDRAISTVESLEKTNDKLRRQLGDIKKYIINNYGDKKWQEITRYFADEQELKQ